MKKTPILFYSDGPCQPTGLGRIVKDLAVLTSQLPEFQVATFGKWARGTSKLPFMQYCFDYQWGENLIEEVWNDFAGATPGIIFTVWDPSRLTWFANPMMGGALESFLRSGRFQRWGYFPIDAHGVHNQITVQLKETVAAYDRVLAYTIYGASVLGNTLGREVDWIPHGYNEKVFQPRGRSAGRAMLQVADDDVLIGMVGTNQARKDWGVAFEAVAILKTRIPSLKFWVQIDELERYWSIPALIWDFGLSECVRVRLTGTYNSEQLSYLYSACDATFLVSHEGFGYPLVESMACGTPVVHGTYGGGTEFIPDRNCLVEPLCLRLDSVYNFYRPVFSPVAWADRIDWVLQAAESGHYQDVCVNAISHLIWKNLWPAAWSKWFLDGLK